MSGPVDGVFGKCHAGPPSLPSVSGNATYREQQFGAVMKGDWLRLRHGEPAGLPASGRVMMGGRTNAPGWKALASGAATPGS